MVLFVHRMMVLWALLFGDISCIISPVSEGDATGIARISDTHLELGADSDKGGVHAGDRGPEYYEVH
jgi:hypothetical protein